MHPKFVIVKTKNDKYEVFYEYKTFFGLRKLKPFITWSGLSQVYPFDSLDSAVRELRNEVSNQFEYRINM